ncbi:hypothetical protein OCU04_012372 [Sclerotinia nivalis]|uniref:Rhodopsin domain-containing protein n=1 Tax=Sclerotinia nivalis TaxID=352851 RepID=A0A9X0AEK2_9HELO|nr:hypothetical protein OCU04_012372 [Sclerotinia nivalis]
MFFKRADSGPQTDASLADLPASILSKVEALAPPAGITPNLTNPEDIGSILVAITAVGLVVISTCVFIRGWMIFKVARGPPRFAWSDFTFTLAFLTIIVLFAAGIVSVTGYGGTIGIHQWDVALSRLFMRQSLISLSIISALYPLALGLVKVTIFLTYIELSAGVAWIRISCTIYALITGAFYLSLCIASFVLIFPHGNETFASHLFTDAPLRLQKTSFPTAAIGMTIDIFLFIVPLIAISKLKGLNCRKKIGAALIFATGFL